MDAPSTPAPSLRCAAVTRSAHVDPVGTAGCYAGFLLLEWPLPWPRDIGDVPELAPVVAALKGRRIRLQGVVPMSGDPQARRAIRYSRTGGDRPTGYDRTEAIAPADRLVSAAAELVSADPPPWTQPHVGDEVLICTHGQRDVCCGSFGTALALELLLGDDDLHRNRFRPTGPTTVMRTSHTGGHRFAPTAIVLPQGTAWAYMDSDALRRILRRTGPLTDLLPRYRGCTALATPRIQALERAAFAEVGWEWLEHRRRGQELPDQRVRLEAEAPDGNSMCWEATVEVRRKVPVPECGLPPDQSKKMDSELMVSDVTCIR